jgi:hypothetical protein
MRFPASLAWLLIGLVLHGIARAGTAGLGDFLADRARGPAQA